MIMSELLAWKTVWKSGFFSIFGCQAPLHGSLDIVSGLPVFVIASFSLSGVQFMFILSETAMEKYT